ncbi:MAG: adenylate/guanylate cyclase domain-containing protein [Dongiaceae bacterium]
MSPTILVVDDEPDMEALILQKFRRQIKGGEFQLVFARDGEEALSILESRPEFDMVLSDINMPRMDGLTLLRHLRDVNDELRTVIVSAYGDMKNIRTAMNLGAFDFVTKPIEFEDLETTIRKTLNDGDKLRAAHRQRLAAERARANLARYFSPNLVAQLADDPDSLNLCGERRELTIMFTDLTDFTPLVETLAPAVIVPLLNEYIDGVTRIVFGHGGTVCKVIGDAVHAVFGAPVEQLDHAGRGVACALAIDAFSEAFRQRKRQEGVSVGATRIGLHMGPVIAGNFGGETFFDYSVYGIATNVAARLENANKQLGTRICVSGAVVDKIPDFQGRPVGTLSLKGLTLGLAAFEPLSGDRRDEPAIQAYREAYAKLQSGDPGARQAFAAVVGQYQEDPLATFHLRRLLAGQTGVEIAI